MSKIRALVGCKNPSCAEEISYPLDMVAMWKGEPICEECYIEETLGDEGEITDWHDLPPVTLADLCE